jgi:hypothetical protein
MKLNSQYFSGVGLRACIAAKPASLQSLHCCKAASNFGTSFRVTKKRSPQPPPKKTR